MSDKKQRYDVIVVGGRVAGSTLAARLGRSGFDVLLLERSEFPSLPAVSSPVIYASTLRMLDEIGADEDDYARGTPKIRAMRVVMDGLQAELPIPEYKGRDYAYAIDRARFDESLWNTAAALPRVDARQKTSVIDLIWDADRVIGVCAKTDGGAPEQLYADLVVGADGRFGLVGRKVNAAVLDEVNTHPTSIYYAYWTGIRPVDGQPSIINYPNEAGKFGYLVMDSADGQTVITIEGRSDALTPQADPTSFYLDLLQQNHFIKERISDAVMVTSVRGMKNIGNSYRQAGGEGWALVGDAYHQKDPLDGQGIYNAVVTGKALTIVLRKWRDGQFATWQDALNEYDELCRIKTYAMYKRLQNQIAQAFYGNRTATLPEPVVNMIGRWLVEDEDVKEMMGKVITRQIPADMATLMTPPLMLRAVARGPLREVRKRLPF